MGGGGEGERRLCLKSPQQVRFNKFYFILFRAKLWKRLNFEWIFVAGNSNKLQKLIGSERKNQLALNPFTLGARHRVH
jgi:hypothetical protein